VLVPRDFIANGGKKAVFFVRNVFCASERKGGLFFVFSVIPTASTIYGIKTYYVIIINVLSPAYSVDKR
jgi:hypothetical protein